MSELLFNACASGDLRKVQELFVNQLFSKDDVNSKDCWDNTSLYYTLQNGFNEIANLLIKNGADANIPIGKSIQRGIWH